MNIHKNARLTPLRREEMACAVIAGYLSQAGAARVYGVSPKIVARWVERFRDGGPAAMRDRSSRPHGIPRQTGQALADHIIALRRQRLTGRHIAIRTGVSPATVSRVLKRAGLSRLKDLERFHRRLSHLKRSISLFYRNSGRETGSHFRWNCSRACRTDHAL
jgi:transposase